MDETVITREGLDRLNAELERLTGEGRREIAQRLERATIGESNFSENADYHEIRDDQALLERRIAVLEDRVRSARVVEPQFGNGCIDVGERARLRDLDSGERIVIELVGPFEADARAGRISTASPVGRAVAGLRRGQIAEVDAPRGMRRLKVTAVETA